MLESTDPNPWRRSYRESWFLADPKERRKIWQRLADDSAATQQPVLLLTLLANKLDSPEEAVQLLQRIQRQRPDDFAVNAYLAEKLMECSPPQITEAVRFYNVAVALLPESSRLSTDMGIALKMLGRPDEANAAFHRSIKVSQDKAAAHFGMGCAFTRFGFKDLALTQFHEAARLAPQNCGGAQ